MCELASPFLVSLSSTNNLLALDMLLCTDESMLRREKLPQAPCRKQQKSRLNGIHYAHKRPKQAIIFVYLSYSIPICDCEV